MASWADLDAELELWHAAGEVPTFWWRDDDTQAPTDALDRLIAITEPLSIPLHLAVIPTGIDPGLASRLAASETVWVLQHGLVHKNHAPKGERASEVGVSRDLALIRQDLGEGWRLLTAAALPRTLPVIVPPWNRIGEQVVPHLSGMGYGALSRFGARTVEERTGTLKYQNAHIDPIRWKAGAVFTGVDRVLEQCVSHLRGRRTGAVDKSEPTGFLTHHLQTDQDTWEFCAAFADRLSAPDQAQWIPLASVLQGSAHG